MASMITEKQWKKLKLAIIKRFPYNAAHIVFSVNFRVERLTVGQVRITGRNIIFNEELLDKYDFDSLVQIACSPVLYFQLMHAERGKKVINPNSAEDKFLWTIASEIARSDLLLTLGIAPIIYFTPGDFDLPKHLSAEAYYYKLHERFINSQKYQSNCDISDTLSDADTDADATSNISESCEIGEAQEAELNDDVKQDYAYRAQAEATNRELIKYVEKAAHGIGRGLLSMHGEVEYFNEKFYPEKYRDIQRLQTLLISLCGQGPGKYDYTRRPRRRNADPKILLPNMERKGFGKTAVIVDVSGSTAEYRDEVFQSLANAIRATGTVDVYIGDTTILEEKYSIRDPERVNLISGGGTDMAYIMEEVDKKGYHNIVVVTDGLTPWPTSPLTARTIYFPIGAFSSEVPEWMFVY